VAPSFSNGRSPYPPSHHRWPIFAAAVGKDDARSNETVITELVYDEEQEDNEHLQRRVRLLESENSHLQEMVERLTKELSERALSYERNAGGRHEVGIISVRTRQVNAPGAPKGAMGHRPHLPHTPDQRRAVSAVPVAWGVTLATLV
jgi:hypothetical protein